jgi:hypothetical protein
MVSGQPDVAERQYLRTIFDVLPLPAFIVDEDVRIEDHNAAAAVLLGPEPEMSIHRRGGEVLHCIRSEPGGCGQSHWCKECVIRNSVKTALDGRVTHRKMHKAEIRRCGKIRAVDLLVTATPLLETEVPRVLLLLEDISELLTLRGLLPICCQCKKVRDDKQYWHNLENYLHTQAGMKLTHGLCPVCFAEQMKALEAISAAGAGG